MRTVQQRGYDMMIDKYMPHIVLYFAGNHRIEYKIVTDLSTITKWQNTLILSVVAIGMYSFGRNI